MRTLLKLTPKGWRELNAKEKKELTKFLRPEMVEVPVEKLKKWLSSCL